MSTPKFSFKGSLNYVLQAWRNKETGNVQIDQYQPRRNTVYTGEIEEAAAIEDIKETIERMKIAIGLFEEFIAGKTDVVYFWQNEESESSYGNSAEEPVEGDYYNGPEYDQ